MTREEAVDHSIQRQRWFRRLFAGAFGLALIPMLGSPAGKELTTRAVPADVTTPGPAPVLNDQPVLRDVDGGPSYYGRFTDSLPVTSDYFPIAVWYETVGTPAEVASNRAAGINTYLELSENANIPAIRDSGSYALMGWLSPLASGVLLGDEVDMWAGPGDAAWTGKYPGQGEICRPAGSACGYTILNTWRPNVPQGDMIASNFGKGVTFWESDLDAARFVNFPDVVSADNYWFTDPDICGASQGGKVIGAGRALSEPECRRASNYGWTTERVRSLVRPLGSKPVWNFVEIGHPSSDPGTPTITGPQIRAAVWSGLIHGARGIVYFNHSFSGSCVSIHVLRDPCGAEARRAVTAVNRELESLAPVLNAPFVDHLVTVDGAADAAAKLHNGTFYVLAGATGAGGHPVTFTVACGSPTQATVLGEGRTIPMISGAFTDRFTDANTVHLYRLDGGSTCGL
jgi:hypothetical protein